MITGIHTFLVGVTTQAIGLLPRRVHGALDAWSLRIARQRAARRQRAYPKR